MGSARRSAGDAAAGAKTDGLRNSRRSNWSETPVGPLTLGTQIWSPGPIRRQGASYTCRLSVKPRKASPPEPRLPESGSLASNRLQPREKPAGLPTPAHKDPEILSGRGARPPGLPLHRTQLKAFKKNDSRCQEEGPNHENSRKTTHTQMTTEAVDGRPRWGLSDTEVNPLGKRRIS